MSGSTAKNYKISGDKWIIGGEIELVGDGAITKNGQPIGGGGGNEPAEVLRDATSTVAGFQFWGETIDGSASNPGFPVGDKKGLQIIVKNNTDVTITQIRAYCFLRDGTGAELHRAQADFADLAAGAELVIDASNFPGINGAWTHISLRTNSTGRTTGDVRVIYASGVRSATEGHFWAGKAANFLGDSITQGVGASGSASRYSTRVAALLGLTENNYGVSGSTIAVKESSPTDRSPMVTRYASMSATADLVVVAGGTNDWFYTHTPVGDFSSRSNNDFYGALHNLCLGLLDKYTGKQLLFLTPIKRSYQPLDAPDAKNGNDLTLQDYADIIKEVCGFYGIPTLDNYRELAINPAIPAQKTALIPDGVHPNDAGHDMMARRVVGYLRQLKY